MSDRDPDPTNLEQLASDRPEPGLLGELAEFLGQNKKWWLWPIVAVLALFGILAGLAGTSVAPFIYTLF
jgi:hypothetical protein